MPTERVGDMPKHETCTHPEHNPPQHQVFRDGHYRHTCPSCGHVQRFTVRGLRWSS